MKAIQLIRHDIGALAPDVGVILTETDTPVPGPGNLLVKIRASAIQPSDILNATGGFPYTTFPRVPGRDYAGIIVSGPRAGEDVYGTSGSTHAFTCDGFHAEYCVVSEDAVARKPRNMSYAQAACIGVPFTTAKWALRKACPKGSETVLIIGAFGSVGSAAVQLAKTIGCRVLTAGRNDVADINTTKDTTLAGIESLTLGRGIDVVIDTVGIPTLTQAAVQKLTHGGRIAIIAAHGEANLDVNMKDFYRQEKTLIGCNSLSYSVQSMAQEMADLTAEFENGRLAPPREELWSAVSLEEAVDIYKEGKRSAGKFVITMG
ncbi:LAME_0H17194g1_1 [Lachancea meyersii CBS 8951]|uniref:LAME_0H17194g1_1 n=1 Tax=Lachancea meyersii CBS 8951 TaxID=1266667 RepID=A0A1G4KI91_9SACH|nr:LAME_0H17194g1_1 [Lachancea meyersii CBS 8951]